MRAVSGSGKTSIAERIVSCLQDVDFSVTVHSTDDFFIVDNRYVFDIERLGTYHNTNLESFTRDLAEGVDVVICDNMNLLPWQSEPYTDTAREYGYRILFLNFLPRELDKHLAAQQITSKKPDAHNLSEDLLIRFIDDFNIYNELLNRDNPIAPARHFTYVWDSVKCERLRANLPIRHFDVDHIITIKPDEYKQTLQDIGRMVLDYIQGEKPE
jgi:hypothetical protein